MSHEINELVDAVWEMMPRGTVNSDSDVEHLVKEENHDIDIETVDFGLVAD